MLPLDLYARVRISLHIAHETAGAARTRSSLRPLIAEGEEFLMARARRAARTRRHVFRQGEERMRRSNPQRHGQTWIASRSLSSGAHSRDRLARNNGWRWAAE